MLLVVDANVVISALLSSAGKSRALLVRSEFDLHSPKILLDELGEHQTEILEKSGLSDLEFGIALSQIFTNIGLSPASEYGKFMETAVQISPDIDDAHYLALALHLDCPVWSNDKRLKKQHVVTVYSTHELVRMLEPAPAHE